MKPIINLSTMTVTEILITVIVTTILYRIAESIIKNKKK